MFVAEFGQADVALVDPDFHPLPGKGIKAQLDDATAQMRRHLPEAALQADGGIQTHPALGPMQKEPLPVGVGIGRAQGDGPSGEALGGTLAFQTAVRALMVFDFQPTPETLIKRVQSGDWFENQASFKVFLERAEKPFQFSPTPSRIRLGVEETDLEIGANDLQMLAGENLAAVGVKLVGQTSVG